MDISTASSKKEETDDELVVVAPIQSVFVTRSISFYQAPRVSSEKRKAPLPLSQVIIQSKRDAAAGKRSKYGDWHITKTSPIIRRYIVLQSADSTLRD